MSEVSRWFSHLPTLKFLVGPVTGTEFETYIVEDCDCLKEHPACRYVSCSSKILEHWWWWADTDEHGTRMLGGCVSVVKQVEMHWGPCFPFENSTQAENQSCKEV